MMRKIAILIISIFLLSCSIKEDNMNDKKIILLAHSTGTNLYNQGRISEWFNSYNRDNDSNYSIELQIFPKARFYGWKNYPYDYWNIWVNHKGYKFEPSIKKLSKKYDVIIWKHCFPGSAIDEDKENPIVDDEDKSLAAYKLQYNALKEAMHEFPNTKFLVWTLAVTRRRRYNCRTSVKYKTVCRMGKK